jgi:hypothetical protein
VFFRSSIHEHHELQSLLETRKEGSKMREVLSRDHERKNKTKERRSLDVCMDFLPILLPMSGRNDEKCILLLILVNESLSCQKEQY